MSRSQDPDHFFQTSQSLAETSRKAAKSKNEYGAPIRLKSKILAVIVDPAQDGAVYLAESAGQVRKLILDVSNVAILLVFSVGNIMLIPSFLRSRLASPPRYIEVPLLLSPLSRFRPTTPFSSLAAGIKRSGLGPYPRPLAPLVSTSRVIQTLSKRSCVRGYLLMAPLRNHSTSSFPEVPILQ